MTGHRGAFRIGALALALAVAAAAAGCGGTSSDTVLTLYAETEAAPVLRNLGAVFENANPGVDVQVETVERSTLVAAAASDDAADLVASADLSGLDTAGDGTVFAEDPLRIAVTFGNPLGITGLDDFADSGLAIGLPDENTARGAAALQALGLAAITPSVDVTNTDVWALLADVEVGDLDAIIARASDVTAELGYVDGIAIPDEYQVPQRYAVAVLSSADAADTARAFAEFVASTEGRDIVESFGMVAP